MKRRGLVLGMFVGLALAQVAAPVSMIVRRELTLHRGRQFKFRTAPVDPYDVFRGRYVALRFESNTAPRPPGVDLAYEQEVYALIGEDEEGFARFTGVSTERPEGDAWIRTKVRRVDGGDVHLALPFDRYYIEEALAQAAEDAYAARSVQGRRDVYVTVRVRNGFAVLEELYLGGKPVREFFKDRD